MAFNIVETSAAVAFKNFVNFDNKTTPVEIQYSSYPGYSIYPDRRTSLERETEDTCIDNLHPKIKYFIVHNFSEKIRSVLINTSYRAVTVMDDIIEKKENSVTFNHLYVAQISFLSASQQCLSNPQLDLLLNNISIKKKSEIIQSVFDFKTNITQEDYDYLGRLAKAVDRMKDGNSKKFFIDQSNGLLQPKETEPQELLFPRVIPVTPKTLPTRTVL